MIDSTKLERDKVFGKIYFNSIDPTEQQDFCWHMTEENVPSDQVIELIGVLKENDFVSIDKLTVPIEEVFKKVNESDFNKFKVRMDELFNVEVKMIDDGEETDSFYIHN